MPTTPYSIRIAPPAQNQISALPDQERKRLLRVIEALAINPRPPGAKKIAGITGLYVENVDKFRIIYKIDDKDILILLAKN